MIASSNSQVKVKKRWVLAAMTCCLSCIFLDTTIVPVAAPSIQKELGFSGFFLQWLINIFYVSTAVFVIFAGKLSDTFGRKKIFSLGMLLYLIGSICSAFCFVPSFLLFCRAIQGIGVAFMTPSAMAILTSEFPAHQLGKALGFSAGVSSIFLSLGPFIAGIVTELSSWRYIFFLPIPLCLLGLLLTVIFVPKGEKNKSKLDIKGLILLMIGVGTLMFGLMQAKYWGWFSPRLINYTLISSAVLMVLYYHSRLIDFPLLDFSLFRIRSFNLGIVLGFITQFVATYTVFIALFFQKALYLSPIASGAYVVVSNLPILIFAPIAGILIDAKGVRFPLIGGFISLIFSILILIAYTSFQKQVLLFLGLALFGASLSLVQTPVSYVTLKEIPLVKKGLAAGIYNTIRALGSSFGIVCIGWVGYFFRLASLKSSMRSLQLPKWMEAQKVDEILKMSNCIPENIIQSVKLINTKSFLYSLNAMSVFICLFVCFGLLLTLLYLYDYKKAKVG